MVTFGDRLREQRERAGLSQREVAEKLGFSQAAYSQYETMSKAPNVYTAQKLADMFGVSVEYLIRGGGNNDS